MDRFLFYHNIGKNNNLNFRQVHIYLDIFYLIIPASTRSIIYKYTYYSRTVQILYYIVEIYKNIHDTKLTPRERYRRNLQFSVTIQLEFNLSLFEQASQFEQASHQEALT